MPSLSTPDLSLYPPTAATHAAIYFPQLLVPRIKRDVKIILWASLLLAPSCAVLAFRIWPPSLIAEEWRPAYYLIIIAFGVSAAFNTVILFLTYHREGRTFCSSSSTASSPSSTSFQRNPYSYQPPHSIPRPASSSSSPSSFSPSAPDDLPITSHPRTILIAWTLACTWLFVCVAVVWVLASTLHALTEDDVDDPSTQWINFCFIQLFCELLMAALYIALASRCSREREVRVAIATTMASILSRNQRTGTGTGAGGASAAARQTGSGGHMQGLTGVGGIVNHPVALHGNSQPVDVYRNRKVL